MNDPASRDQSTTTGERIVALRRAASLSQPELAARAGVSTSTVYRAERGDSSIGPRMVARIAAALAVDPSEIHSGDVLLRSELPLSAERAEEQHEEVMRGIDDIQSSIDED